MYKKCNVYCIYSAIGVRMYVSVGVYSVCVHWVPKLMLLYRFPEGHNIKGLWLGLLGYFMIFPAFLVLLWM